MGHDPAQNPASGPAHATERPRGRRRRVVFTLLLLALAGSVTFNVVLYRRTLGDYRSLSEIQLDPYGLKRPGFPPDPAPVDAGEKVLVFFGDSRARQWPAPQAPGWRVVNRGIGGQTTEQMRGRFDAHIAPLSPSVVVVQGGVNDVKAIPLFPHLRDEIVADCKANLRDLVRRARARGAVVVITTVFPTGPVPLERRAVWSADVERAVQEVNADLRTITTEGVIVLDAWKLLSTEGRLRDEYAADTLHLTAQGYQVLNDELKKVLAPLQGG